MQTKEVTVTLFQDDKEYSQPVFVKVNGNALLIPRGVPVTIPREHYEALRHTQRQAQSVSRYEQMLVERTDTKMSGNGQTLSGLKPPRVQKVRL